MLDLPNGLTLILSTGDGSLTLVTGKLANSNNGDILVTAWDVDLDGSVSTGTATLNLHGAKVRQTIALGATAKDMHIDDAEMYRNEKCANIQMHGRVPPTCACVHV